MSFDCKRLLIVCFTCISTLPFIARSGELLQIQETVPVTVPAWTQARATGVIPA